MRLTSFLSIILLSLTATCIAQPFPDANKWYIIFNAKDSLAIEQPCVCEGGNCNTLNAETKLTGTVMNSSKKNQQWKFIKVGESGNLYMIVNRAFNTWMDVPYGRKNAGETLFGYKNKGGSNQQFFLVKTLDNKYFISSKVSGYPLSLQKKKEQVTLFRPEDNDIRAEAHPEGCNPHRDKENFYLKQLELTGAENQRWSLIEIPGTISNQQIIK